MDMIVTQQTQVKYDRSARSWQARNGSTVGFGPGKDARLACCLFAIGSDAPELFDVIAEIAYRHGQERKLVDRLVRAAQLILQGKVFADGVVWSQYGDGAYDVVEFAGHPRSYTCTCEDFARGGARVDWQSMGCCKHALAIHLCYLADVELDDCPIPF